MEDIKEIVKGIIAEVLELEEESILDDVLFAEQDEVVFDSLNAFDILVKIEKKLKIKIPTGGFHVLRWYRATPRTAGRTRQGKRSGAGPQDERRHRVQRVSGDACQRIQSPSLDLSRHSRLASIL